MREVLKSTQASTSATPPAIQLGQTGSSVPLMVIAQPVRARASCKRPMSPKIAAASREYVFASMAVLLIAAATLPCALYAVIAPNDFFLEFAECIGCEAIKSALGLPTLLFVALQINF